MFSNSHCCSSFLNLRPPLSGPAIVHSVHEEGTLILACRQGEEERASAEGQRGFQHLPAQHCGKASSADSELSEEPAQPTSPGTVFKMSLFHVLESLVFSTRALISALQTFPAEPLKCLGLWHPVRSQLCSLQLSRVLLPLQKLEASCKLPKGSSGSHPGHLTVC